MKYLKEKTFANGAVYAFEVENSGKNKYPYKIEITDTFLPYYTKFCINNNSNKLEKNSLGSRKERWMIGVSCMSGCPVGCKFCATGQMKSYRNLWANEIYNQVRWIIDINATHYFPEESKEFKINYTRMGEPFLNIGNLRSAIKMRCGILKYWVLVKEKQDLYGQHRGFPTIIFRLMQMQAG